MWKRSTFAAFPQRLVNIISQTNNFIFSKVEVMASVPDT
jgi:hypothetical protein